MVGSKHSSLVSTINTKLLLFICQRFGVSLVIPQFTMIQIKVCSSQRFYSISLINNLVGHLLCSTLRKDSKCTFKQQTYLKKLAGSKHSSLVSPKNKNLLLFIFQLLGVSLVIPQFMMLSVKVCNILIYFSINLIIFIQWCGAHYYASLKGQTSSLAF